MPSAVTFDAFEKELSRLVGKFEKDLEVKSTGYKEQQLREDYLNLFFDALGWDRTNKLALIQREREVEIESRTDIAGRQKSADYLFRTGGHDRFICEAKKPREDLGPKYAFQAKRYAWNKGLALAVLTDFEELKLYIVGGKPHIDDGDVGLWKTWHYKQFPLAAQEIFDLLSRDAIAGGSIDRLLDSLPKRPSGKGKARQLYLIKPDRTRSLDADFLEFLDEARRDLASDLLKSNDRDTILEGTRLNEATHQILDRILFLRICEDRDIDTGTRLQAIVETWQRSYGHPSGKKPQQQQLRIREDDSGYMDDGASGGGSSKVPKESLWAAIVRHFKALDRRPPSHVPFFNGNLFKPHFSEKFLVSDEWLQSFIGELSDDESPYLFNVIPVEILGSVYERFLGKVVRPHGRGVIIEEKPEVRKAGGVYYTPRYIVDYIVEQTVGRQLDEIAGASGRAGFQPSESTGSVGRAGFQPSESTGSVGRAGFQPADSEHPAPSIPIQSIRQDAECGRQDARPTLAKFEKQTRALHILDPACGSGSFLIRAFERVSEHWQRRFKLHPAERRKELCWVDPITDDVHLTVDLKRRILRDNIYGVDLDGQAVEVTQLSLYLKMLEGEDRTTLQRQRELFKDDIALLPPLQDNIKCGNSLIASDFSLDPDDLLRVNAFDWDTGFRDIMKSGGFDAVIGNPPYVRQESLKEQKDYFERNYEAFSSTGDLYTYFMEKGVKLIRSGGRYSIIVSSSILRATYAEALRETLLKHAALERIVDFGGFAVFADAKDTYVCIPVFCKGQQQTQVEVSKVASLDEKLVNHEMSKTNFTAPLTQFTREMWALRSQEEIALFRKLYNGATNLGTLVGKRMYRGVLTGLNEAFVVTTARKKELISASPKSSTLIHAARGGEDVREFFIEPTDAWLIVLPAGYTRQAMGSNAVSETKAWAWLNREHSSIAAHLESFAKPLRARQDQGDFWWELRPCDYYDVFSQPKIVFPDICKFPRFSYDDTGVYLTNTAYALGTGDKYLVGILNSRVFWFAISHISIPFGVRAGEFRYRLIYQYMEKVPIRALNLSKPADKATHKKMVDLVDKRLTLTPKLREAKEGREQAVLQNAVTATDRKIDELVYELYGLTAEEIQLVEGTA